MNSRGKYKTKISLERGEKNYHSNGGLVHRFMNLKYRVVGDIPSVSKKIKYFRPHTIKGHIIKLTLLTANFIIRDTLKTEADILKASETGLILSGKEAVRTASYKIRDKYRENAIDDYNKGSLFIAKSSFDAIKGTRYHIKMKKRYKSEKQKYQNVKLELKELKIKRKPQKDVKDTESDLKKEYKFTKKIKKQQYTINKLSKPDLIFIKPVKYYSNQIKESAINKAVHEDDNDMLKAAYEVKKHVTDRIADNHSKHRKLKKAEKKHERLVDKFRMQKQKSKLQNGNQNKNQNKHSRKRKNSGNTASKSVLEKLNNSVLQLFKGMNGHATKEVTATIISTLVPVFFILIIFYFIIMIFMTILSGSGFVLGTYNAQDYALSEAEKYYTKLAWDMNENIIMIDSSDWKKGLKELGADTSSMNDTPDRKHWGRSSEFNYDPVYDFDAYKLWSFLCAYYYEFSDDKNNQDIKYWKFNDDTKSVIKDLFNDEYTFEYRYSNTSHWETLNHYKFEGGIDGSYWLTESDKTYKDAFYPDSLPGDLHEFKDDNGYIHFNSNLEVLNAKKDYCQTGWFIQDQRYIVRDNSGQQGNPFYSWFNDSEFGRYYGESYYPRSNWGWDDMQCYWLVSPQDTLHWRNDLENRCLVSYYKANEWIKDCSLFYNVKQKQTMEQAILKKLGTMNNSEERIAYYFTLTGTETSASYYGNHQTLKNILSGDTIRNYQIFNSFGWNISNWNSKHCNYDNAVHEGTDFKCSPGSEIHSPFECKIQSYENNTVVLRKNDVRYWYDGNKGKKRDTEVTIGNVKLKEGYSIGDTVKQGDTFAYSTDTKHCNSTDNSNCDNYIHIQTKIDTDGIGWNYIDPVLIVY